MLIRPVPASFDGTIRVLRIYSEGAADPRPVEAIKAASVPLGSALARARGLSPFSKEGAAVAKALERRIDAAKAKNRGQDIATFQRDQCRQLAFLLTDLGLQAEAVQTEGVSIPAVVVTAGSGHPDLDRVLFTALAPNVLDTTFIGEYTTESRRFTFANGRVTAGTEAYPLAS